MGTPRKNFNYYSPYSQNVRQYPSQTSEYMSQHAGGMQSPQQNNNRGNSNQNTPHFYNNTTPQRQSFGFYEDKESSTPHFYQNNTPQQQQGQGRGRGFGHRGGRRGGGGGQQYQQYQRQYNDQKPQYFHQSMLEDPWQELMERHNAIHGKMLNDEPDLV